MPVKTGGLLVNKREIFNFLRENHLCFMATVDGNKPRVRAMDTYRADENGIIFYTNKQKHVYKQIAKNPEVEICYHDPKKTSTIRVSGRMESLDDLELKKEIIEALPFLKEVYSKENYTGMAVCRLKNGKANIFSMKDMGAPNTYVDL
jgi:pyridoxamine 5'-phosphate oxidase